MPCIYSNIVLPSLLGQPYHGPFRQLNPVSRYMAFGQYDLDLLVGHQGEITGTPENLAADIRRTKARICQ